MFISNAYAASAAGQFDPSSIMFLLILAVFAFFFIIRPHMKQDKEQRNLIAALQKGDEVTTAGGIVGRITKVSDGFVGLEIAPEIIINVQKHTVQTLLPKGTIKTL